MSRPPPHSWPRSGASTASRRRVTSSATSAWIRARRNNKIATVAVARKLACLTWQLLSTEQDYIYERPALTFRKLRQPELAAGAPKCSNPRGRNAPATPDTPAQWATERGTAALHIEDDYRATVADWKPEEPPSQLT